MDEDSSEKLYEEKLCTLEADSAEKDTVDQELMKHTADRKAAKKGSAEHEAIRIRESEGHSEMTADANAKIAVPLADATYRPVDGDRECGADLGLLRL